jgi:hypothetical protein
MRKTPLGPNHHSRPTSLSHPRSPPITTTCCHFFALICWSRWHPRTQLPGSVLAHSRIHSPLPRGPAWSVSFHRAISTPASYRLSGGPKPSVPYQLRIGATNLRVRRVDLTGDLGWFAPCAGYFRVYKRTNLAVAPCARPTLAANQNPADIGVWVEGGSTAPPFLA